MISPQISPACLSLVPGFPGCLEDEEFPFTSIKSAIYQDPLISNKWVDQPNSRWELIRSQKILFFIKRVPC